MRRRTAFTVLLALAAGGAAAQDVPRREPLGPRFEGSGGGIMIDGCRPVVIGGRCATRFTATTPAREVHVDCAVFEARPMRAARSAPRAARAGWGGSAVGTTPLVAFPKRGVVRRAP